MAFSRTILTYCSRKQSDVITNVLYCHSAVVNPDQMEYDMDIETARKTVDLIFQTPNNSIMIEFQGGEPLLNMEAVKFITKYAKEKNKTARKNLKFSLISNLESMSDEAFEYFKKEGISFVYVT